MKMFAFSSYFVKNCRLSVSWLGTGTLSPSVTHLSVLSLHLDGHRSFLSDPGDWPWTSLSLCSQTYDEE